MTGTVARAIGYDPYLRIVEFFDRDKTAGAFLREDGEGGFLGGISRMAREIDRLRALTASASEPRDAEATAKAIDWLKAMTTEDWLLLDKYMPDDLRERLRAALTASASEPGPVAEDSRETCQRCQGNGEIVTDWERYRHPNEGDVGDEAVAECPDCNGVGSVTVPTPDGAVAVSMTPEEHRLEDLKQMAAYSGPIVSFECREPYYLASCDHCGWVGSSELCGTDSFGDDSDVYCPRCHSSGADCGKVAETLSAALSHSADGWRGMSSAPKDGSRILTVRRFGDNLCEAAIVRWSQDESEWWDDDADQFAYPDLWMPLAAPLDAKAERE